MTSQRETNLLLFCSFPPDLFAAILFEIRKCLKKLSDAVIRSHALKVCRRFRRSVLDRIAITLAELTGFLSSSNDIRKLRLPSKDLQLLVANGSAHILSFGCSDLGAHVHNFASKEKTE